MPEGSCCGSPKTLRFIVACSGAADVGETADRVARRLAKGGAGKMTCLAGVSGRAPLVVDNLGKAGAIIAVDGCQEDCARRTLEIAGLPVARHLRMTDFGLEKGKSPATEDSIASVLSRVQTSG